MAAFCRQPSRLTLQCTSSGDPANDIHSFAQELGIKDNFSIAEIQIALITKYQSKYCIYKYINTKIHNLNTKYITKCIS